MNQNYFINLKRLAKNHFKKMKKKAFHLKFDLFQYCTPMLIRKLPLNKPKETGKKIHFQKMKKKILFGI